MSDWTFEQMWKAVQLHAPDCPQPLCGMYVNKAYRRAATYDRWSGLRIEKEVRIPLIYNAGTVTVTQGSTTVAGAAGATFTSAMINRQFMAQAQAPIYTITAVPTSSTLTLDRTYERESAANLPYEINQIYVEAPSDFGAWDVIRDIDNNWKLHTNFQQKQIDIWDAKRLQVGTPWVVAEAPNRVTTAGAVVPRFEFWPRPQGPKTYAYRYIVAPIAMAAPTDRMPTVLRGDVILKGALAELCLWPGTATLKNPYYNISQHSLLEREFQDELKELWKQDQERGQTAILYEDWEGVPYAPIDARYLQTHDVF
jgi:hypothetical protein